MISKSLVVFQNNIIFLYAGTINHASKGGEHSFKTPINNRNYDKKFYTKTPMYDNSKSGERPSRLDIFRVDDENTLEGFAGSMDETPIDLKERGGIAGTVYDHNGQLTVGIDVKLLDHFNHIIDSVKTNSRGEYFFNDLDPANYIIQVSLSPYPMHEAKVVVVDGKLSKMDIKLGIME